MVKKYTYHLALKIVVSHLNNRTTLAHTYQSFSQSNSRLTLNC